MNEAPDTKDKLIAERLTEPLQKYVDLAAVDTTNMFLVVESGELSDHQSKRSEAYKKAISAIADLLCEVDGINIWEQIRKLVREVSPSRGLLTYLTEWYKLTEDVACELAKRTSTDKPADTTTVDTIRKEVHGGAVGQEADGK